MTCTINVHPHSVRSSCCAVGFYSSPAPIDVKSWPAILDLGPQIGSCACNFSVAEGYMGVELRYGCFANAVLKYYTYVYTSYMNIFALLYQVEVDGGGEGLIRGRHGDRALENNGVCAPTLQKTHECRTIVI